MNHISIFRILLIPMFVVTTGFLAEAEELPSGVGKDDVQALCSGCHGVNRISNGLGYSRENWLSLIDTMIDLTGDKARQNMIADYLAENFPPNEKRKPTIIEGNTTIAFKEWITPSHGQRTRDPVEAPDGTIWWVGQWGNVIGRLDTETGEMQEYPLPAGAMPHSVTPDEAGNMWYTGNKNGTVGRLDPATGSIKVYNMPQPEARDPHTGVFDAKGIFWFTLQNANRIGRLDPVSGDIKLITLPTKRSRPYGIKIADTGDIWVACNGSNCLIKLNPLTLELQEIKLPNELTTVRRLDIASDGNIWYVNSSRGRLGRYNPTSHEVHEWPSPSGPLSHPYALEVLNDVVWYNESGMRPDTLVRFDPSTETFQSWTIPSGNFYAGIVRHMRPTRGGDLLIHQSATNRIIRVEIDD